MRAFSTRLLLLAGTLALAACDAGPTVNANLTVVEVVEEDEEFSVLDAVLGDVGLRARLQEGGPYTLFAPTDVAFESLGAATLAALRNPANRDLLVKVIEAHIVPREIRPEDLLDGDRLRTLQGTELMVRVVDGQVTVGGVGVRRVASATNGFVYAVNTLLRDHLTAAERIRVSSLLGTIREALGTAGLLDELDGPGPFTLFLPIDDAFGALGPGAVDRLLNNRPLLERLVTNHIVQGDYARADLTDGQVLTSEAGAPLHITTSGADVQVEGVEVLLADIPASNGRIHLVRNVLTSNLNVNEAAALAGLDLWVEAVDQAGLASTLAGEGPFTVFAPLNGAWVSEADVSFLRTEGLLPRIARVHVVPGYYNLSALRDLSELPTLEGASLTLFQTVEGASRIGRSAYYGVLRGDIIASNGIIHVVEQVIDPPMNLFEAVVFERRKRFVEGLHLTGLDAELAASGPYTVFAPTQEAWGRVNPALLARLFEPANRDQLEAILRYHIAEGSFTPAQMPGSVTTLEGSDLSVAVTPQGIFVGDEGAAAIFSFVRPTNGLLYQVDQVLFPPEP